MLLARAGEVVTRDELRAAIWGGHTHVDYDRGLAYCMAQVRTALGDSGENPRFVQTLPKRGFRFLAPVTIETNGRAPLAGQSGDATAAPTAPAPPPAARTWAGRGRWLTGAAALVLLALVWVRADGPPRPAIVAVSIFDNETGDAALDGFVSGLSDLVVTRLTEMAPDRVAVVGNAAALRRPRAIRNLRTLATEVRADYIVIGQLQREDEGLRFILHFIRLRDEVHLSARRLVGERPDVTGLEDQVLREAERVVRAHLVGPPDS